MILGVNMNALVALVLLLWGLAAVAEVSGKKVEKEKLVWVVPNWPHTSMDVDTARKTSAFMYVLTTLQEALPNYEHHLISGNADKAVRMWKEGKNVCGAPLLKTKERMNYAVFVAFFAAPPYRVVVKNSQVSALMANKTSLSLSELLSNKNIKGGLIQDRSYGELMDSYLNDQKGFKNWSIFEPKENWTAVLSMVKNGRIDYTLEMEEFVSSYNRESAKGAPLVTLPIKELSEPLVTYVGCTRNEWGAAITKIIDKRMQALALTPEYQKSVEEVFRDTGIKEFKEDLQEFYLKRSEGPMIY